MKRVFISCRCCSGRGRIELTGVYLDTLKLLRRQSGEVNGAMLAKMAGCKATAMNNRLIQLEAMGLAVGKRYGRQRHWSAL